MGVRSGFIVKNTKKCHLDSVAELRFFSPPPQIKLAFFVAIVGVVLTVLGVGTEFWVELAPPKGFYNNQVLDYC